MDIPALSMAMSQQNVMTDIGTAVLSMSIDMAQQTGDGLTKLMEQSVTPNLGGTVDITI